MPKIEHDYVALNTLKDVNGFSFDKFIAVLKSRGEQGWELCGFEYGCAFFRRPTGETIPTETTA